MGRLKHIRPMRKGSTFALFIPDKSFEFGRSYFVQVSPKKPFRYPRVEPLFENGSWIAGWLLFYFGIIISHGKKAKPNG